MIRFVVGLRGKFNAVLLIVCTALACIVRHDNLVARHERTRPEQKGLNAISQLYNIVEFQVIVASPLEREAAERYNISDILARPASSCEIAALIMLGLVL